MIVRIDYVDPYRQNVRTIVLVDDIKFTANLLHSPASPPGGLRLDRFVRECLSIAKARALGPQGLLQLLTARTGSLSVRVVRKYASIDDAKSQAVLELREAIPWEGAVGV
jgi:hypothetical protein